MRFTVAEDYESASRAAAEVILAEVARKPDAVLCLPTGSTPERTYAILAERARADPQIFASVRIVQLDEWGGLPRGDDSTCQAYLTRHVLGPLKVGPERFLGFDSDPTDPAAECAKFRERLAALGGIDLCLLGLGENGHIGLNEPADALEPFAHVAELSEHSRRHKMLTGKDTRRLYGLTLGVAEILQSRRVLLIVSGKHKARPLAELKSGRISTRCPASLLWLHPQAECICDRDALVTPCRDVRSPVAEHTDPV